MLLGSPPDTVHGATLRGTGLSSLLIQVRRHIIRPGAGIHPRCSGLRVQGTAISPTSAALLCAETWGRAVNIVLYLPTIINENFFFLLYVYLYCLNPRAFPQNLKSTLYRSLFVFLHLKLDKTASNYQ